MNVYMHNNVNYILVSYLATRSSVQLSLLSIPHAYVHASGVFAPGPVNGRKTPPTQA